MDSAVHDDKYPPPGLGVDLKRCGGGVKGPAEVLRKGYREDKEVWGRCEGLRSFRGS